MAFYIEVKKLLNTCACWDIFFQHVLNLVMPQPGDIIVTHYLCHSLAELNHFKMCNKLIFCSEMSTELT